MANKDTVFGARYVGTLSGSASNAKIRSYTVPASDGTALYVGDFVKLVGSASVGQDGEVRSEVIQAAATDTIVGFVIGFAPDPDALSKVYRTASTKRTVYVCDDDKVLIEIQADGTVAAADIGLNADIVVGTPSTQTGLSGMELDISDKKTGSAQLRIIGIVSRADNEVGDHTKLICMINEHAYKATAGV